jgi:hypothetical protein
MALDRESPIQGHLFWCLAFGAYVRCLRSAPKGQAPVGRYDSASLPAVGLRRFACEKHGEGEGKVRWRPP